ncbi:MAG TPA: DUF3089 domain-containing protein [Sphingomicrobium sp.]|nr:DUF3089 domain-containing protein [Sphingomicrobium sp.]
MCARRFLFVIFVLTLLAVAAAFAMFEWGGNVLLQQATPRGHFEAAEAGSSPDYANFDSWIARPGIADDPSNWLPEGVARAGAEDAATFYVHPTTYLERDRWNAPLHPARQVEARTRLFVQSQASAFNGNTQIWAPRYRQAAYGAFLLKTADAQKALDLAYSDVSAAFDEFVEQVPKDRPIILAGHSQGALHVARLLLDKKPRIRGRLIAAYVVGWPISDSADLPPMGLRACSHPEETGCLLSWLTFAEPANPDLILDSWSGTRGRTGVRRNRRDILCVNPLTGTRGGHARPAANPGTLLPAADLGSATLVPRRVGARCTNGFLYLVGEVPRLGPFVLPGNNYHVYDYALFWGAIRRDTERRLGAWRR